MSSSKSKSIPISIPVTSDSNTTNTTNTANTANTAFCPLCNGVSWTSTSTTPKSVEKSHIASIMNSYPDKERDWCKCKHVLDTDNTEFPPMAGTGDRY